MAYEQAYEAFSWLFINVGGPGNKIHLFIVYKYLILTLKIGTSLKWKSWRKYFKQVKSEAKRS